MKAIGILLAAAILCGGGIANSQDVYSQQKAQDRVRAAYWAEKGYRFDATYMTASMMNQKVVDMQRAAQWRQKGYNFDPTYMTASMMDQKVVDMQRAAQWKQKGYNFSSSAEFV